MSENTSNTEGKPEIDLSLNQAGVIIVFNSGVVYHNQTCGLTCMQRYQEGVLLLPTDPELMVDAPVGGLYRCPIAYALEQMDWNSMTGIDTQRADEIDAVLTGYGFTKKITVDRTRLSESEEAWVYVTLEPLDYGLYSGLGSCRGILVWNNSD